MMNGASFLSITIEWQRVKFGSGSVPQRQITDWIKKSRENSVKNRLLPLKMILMRFIILMPSGSFLIL